MIQVLPYQPEWAAAFDIEAARIAAALGSALLRVHHIGSTAVPQTRAKPVIDILLEVGSLEALDQRTPELETLGPSGWRPCKCVCERARSKRRQGGRRRSDDDGAIGLTRIWGCAQHLRSLCPSTAAWNSAAPNLRGPE